MNKVLKKIPDEEIESVYNFIEDYILENHKLCSVSEILKALNLSEKKCRKILSELIMRKKLVIVYEGKGKPTVYIPTYMFEEILRVQRKPKWLERYTFKEKSEINKKIEDLRKRAAHYEMLERLLYGTGEPLEEAVKYALEYLGFKKVERPSEKDTYDISFVYDGKRYIIEVEGTTKQGSKRKVNQLDGWIKKEIERGEDPGKIVGIFVVNHFRDKDPEERGDPLTDQAKKFLKYHHFKFFTTYFLFNLVKKVANGLISKKEARKLLIEGEKYE